jgi:hypothetical protein
VGRLTTSGAGGRHPNWPFAEQLLGLVLPGARSYDLDDIPALVPDAWTDFPLDDVDPAGVNRALLDYCSPLLSTLIVVSTSCSLRDSVGPFFIFASELDHFMDTYVERYDDVFVAEDVVIVCPSEGVVVAVHHNGLIATVHGQAVAF